MTYLKKDAVAKDFVENWTKIGNLRQNISVNTKLDLCSQILKTLYKCDLEKNTSEKPHTRNYKHSVKLKLKVGHQK